MRRSRTDAGARGACAGRTGATVDSRRSAIAAGRAVARRSERRLFRGALALALPFALAACGAAPGNPVAPRCPTDRVVVLASQADITRLARCATARGVTIRSGAALDTSVLHALATITGDLVIGPTVGTSEITLGELRGVGGTLRVAGNTLMQGLFLPKLERAGRIEIEGNAAIATVSLPKLTAVHGALRITGNASLELVDLSALAAIDQELVLTGDPELALVEAPALKAAASVQIEVPKLSPEVADRLRAIAPTP